MALSCQTSADGPSTMTQLEADFYPTLFQIWLAIVLEGEQICQWEQKFWGLLINLTYSYQKYLSLSGFFWSLTWPKWPKDASGILLLIIQKLYETRICMDLKLTFDMTTDPWFAFDLFCFKKFYFFVLPKYWLLVFIKLAISLTTSNPQFE